MPADFVKFEVIQDGIIEQLMQCPFLNFKSRLSKTGNLVWQAWDKNMKFEIYEANKVVEVSGSLHYLFNDGIHNWNDFNRLDLFDTITGFCSRYNINAKKTVLHTFEIGFNIKVPFEPSNFIERVLAYKTGDIKRLSEKESIKKAIRINFAQYCLKMYDKSNQQRKFLDDKQLNILRFECHYYRMVKAYSICGINSLHDLLKPEILNKLGLNVLSEFREMIVLEPMDLNRMSAAESKTFEQMSNRTFWKQLCDKSKRRDKKKRFKALTKKYGNGLHIEVELMMDDKRKELIQWFDVEDKDKHRTILQGVTPAETVINKKLRAKAKKVNIAPFYRGYNKDTHACNNA
jgi:hypothetical protein